MDWKSTAKQILMERFNDPIQDFATVGDSRENPNAVSSLYPIEVMLLEDWITDLNEIRARLSNGLIAFYGHRKSKSICELVIIQGASQFDGVRFMGTIGNDIDLTTEDIIGKLTELHNKYSIDVFMIDYDSLTFVVENIPNDLTSLATEMSEFCPDIIYQGVGSIDKLIERYQAMINKLDMLVISLWWD